MNFFIDFEATQFSNHIISIDCVSETGEQFYSLVNTTHAVTLFITELTGITEQMVANAPAPEIVFSQFAEWIQAVGNGEKPHFYCYGNSDKQFVQTNFKSCKTFTASAMLSFLYVDLEDYSDKVKSHFGMSQNISLNKVYNYCVPLEENHVQDHNALNDAEMLKRVYEYMVEHKGEFEELPEFKEIIKQKKVKEIIDGITDGKDYMVYRMNSRKTLEVYDSFEDAVNWAYEQIPEGERAKANIKTITKNILKASNGYDEKKKYRNFRWKLVKKG